MTMFISSTTCSFLSCTNLKYPRLYLASGFFLSVLMARAYCFSAAAVLPCSSNCRPASAYLLARTLCGLSCELVFVDAVICAACAELAASVSKRVRSVFVSLMYQTVQPGCPIDYGGYHMFELSEVRAGGLLKSDRGGR